MDKAREVIAEIANIKLFFGSVGVSVGEAAEISVNAADDILAAMPEIIKGMVQPLEWGMWWNQDDGYREVSNVIAGREYHVNDTGWWFPLGKLHPCKGIRASKAAANAHNAAQVLKALGMGDGE